jgi:transketolase
MYQLEKNNTRIAIGDEIFQLAKSNPNVFVIGGDAATSMGLTEMEKTFPERCVNVGIAEQNAMAAACGLASTGLTVFMAGFAPFVTMRAVEQFRTFACYPNLNVKVFGGQGGLSAANEGVTHQGTEDYGIMSIFPNCTVVVPADCNSARAITRVIASSYGPAYIRGGKSATYGIFGPDYNFQIGKANRLQDGDDVTVIACGASVYHALMAAEELGKEGIRADVIEMPCVKPIDSAAIIESAGRTRAVVTVEDHQIHGGLGSAVAEVLSENCPTYLRRLGLRDTFGESGEHYALLDYFGIGVKDIVRSAKDLLALKKAKC